MGFAHVAKLWRAVQRPMPFAPSVRSRFVFPIRRSTMTDEGIELILTVMEAKELIGPANADKFDTFVRIYMVPDEAGALQTKVNSE